jgi:hypothetical protein
MYSIFIYLVVKSWRVTIKELRYSALSFPRWFSLLSLDVQSESRVTRLRVRAVGFLTRHNLPNALQRWVS